MGKNKLRPVPVFGNKSEILYTMEWPLNMSIALFREHRQKGRLKNRHSFSIFRLDDDVFSLLELKYTIQEQNFKGEIIKNDTALISTKIIDAKEAGRYCSMSSYEKTTHEDVQKSFIALVRMGLMPTWSSKFINPHKNLLKY
jgi:hypothetical protein